MNAFRKRIGFVLSGALGVAFLLIGCGGGVGIATSSPSAGTSNLDALPTVNVGNYISGAGATTSLSELPLVSASVSPALVGSVATFSRAGCECRQIKKEMINQGMEIELNNCYVQTIGAAKGLTIEADAFSHFEITIGSEKLRVRLGSFSGTFKMDICELRSGAFVQGMSYDLTTSGNNASGSIVDKFLETGATELDQHSFTFDVKNYSETGTTFNFSTATFAASFNSRYGAGTSTLTANNTSNFNSVTGDFKNGAGTNDFSVRMACQFDNATGAAKYSGNGSFPAFLGSDTGLSSATLTVLGFTATSKLCPNTNFVETSAIAAANTPFLASTGTCTFDASGTEPFQLSGSGSSESAVVIASTATSHFTPVNASTLGTGTIATPTINFTRTWDCSAPTSFTLVDASGVDVSKCTAIQTEIQSDSFENTCDHQQNQAEITESQK